MTAATITSSAFAFDLTILAGPTQIAFLAIVTRPEALDGLAVTDAAVVGTTAVATTRIDFLVAIDGESDGTAIRFSVDIFEVGEGLEFWKRIEPFIDGGRC